jgi:signal transduction histidine kinase
LYNSIFSLTAFNEKIELYKINYQKANPGADYLTSADYKDIVSKYHRQKFMIVTEGGVFILLLLLGLLRVRKLFMREMELAAQQRNFLLSITHELKSPLATVKLSLQTLTKRKLEPEQTEKLIGNSLQDLDRLESLVDNILFAAKIEREEPGLAVDEINISEIVRSVADRFAVNKKGITIREEIKNDIYLNTDTLGFTSVVINLVENAIKYSPEETEVQVVLQEDEGHVFMIVADNGIGISETDKTKVFTKFYRVGSEDTRKTKGTGLGLYIVKRFMEIYKGDISLKDNSPRGTVFTLRFPKTKQP